MNTTTRETMIYPELYKAVLKSELTTCIFSEAVFNLLEALKRRETAQQDDLSELTYSYEHVHAMLAFVLENQKILAQKFKLVGPKLKRPAQ